MPICEQCRRQAEFKVRVRERRRGRKNSVLVKGGEMGRKVRVREIEGKFIVVVKGGVEEGIIEKL